ncbi:hypothetical protein [Paratractidigestivibacter sp.]|uniref:hypothetical protein n=1 Tax=Paratractidigestivibacter sp. TaxID=2847316 RepID=UPI002AC9B1E3|nr:hypothetical protein [Paratractidigestivibacter sp.]
MKGSYEVAVSRRRGTKYQFTVRRNITVIRGDSGTGKTTLFDMVADHMRYGEQSGVSLQCDRPCVALTDMDWRSQLAGFQDSIVFIDEGLKDLLSHDFAQAVRGSSNYFVIIARADLPSLPYSVDEVYKIKTSGKFHSLVPMYAERGGHRHSLSAAKPKQDFSVLVTEDSKAGFQFYQARFTGSGVVCESAGSNAGVLSWLDEHRDERVFVVADGAAFGPYADRVLKLQNEHRDTMAVCLPESFEWLVLASGAVRSPKIEAALAEPSDHIDGAEFMSWEQFFTKLLREEADGTAFAYSKAELAEAYALPQNADKVMALIACRNVK